MDDYEFKLARRRVLRRYILRVTFVANLLFFLLMLLLIANDSSPASDKLAGGVVFSLIYGTFLLFHATFAFNLFGNWIDRAARKEMERQSFEEKPKRQHLELGEDGELQEISDDLINEPKRKHADPY